MNKNINIDSVFESVRKLPPALSYEQIETQVWKGNFGSNFNPIKLIIMTSILVGIISLFILQPNQNVAALELKQSAHILANYEDVRIVEPAINAIELQNSQSQTSELMSSEIPVTMEAITSNINFKNEKVESIKREIQIEDINGLPGAFKTEVSLISDTTYFVIKKTDSEERLDEIEKQILALSNEVGYSEIKIKTKRRKNQIKDIDISFTFDDANNHYDYRLRDSMKNEIQMILIRNDEKKVYVTFSAK